MKSTFTPLVVAAALCSVGVTNAIAYDLRARDLDGDLSTTEAFYDVQQNLTWLRDVNYSRTVGISPFGTLTWQAAIEWASNVNVYGTGGWRLPSLLFFNTNLQPSSQPPTPCGYGGCSYDPSVPTSEIAKLYWEGLHPDSSTFERFGVPYLPFVWLANEFELNADYAWAFAGPSGYPNNGNTQKIADIGVMLVQSGDIGSPVPEPGAISLAAIGLSIVTILRRRKIAQIGT
jgi:hypothetical protein